MITEPTVTEANDATDLIPDPVFPDPTADPDYGVGAAMLTPQEPTPIERIAALERDLAEARRRLRIAEANAAELGADRRHVRSLEEKANEAKDAASKAKKAYETALEAHLDLEESLTTGQARLPLGDPEPGADPEDEPEDEDDADAGQDDPESEDSPDNAAPADPDAAWRGLRLDDLGFDADDPDRLSPTILAALAEAGLTTVGELADFTALNRRLTDVPGIGKAKAERIENTLDAFWRRWAVERSRAVESEVLAGVREAEAARHARQGGQGTPHGASDGSDGETRAAG